MAPAVFRVLCKRGGLECPFLTGKSNFEGLETLPFALLVFNWSMAVELDISLKYTKIISGTSLLQKVRFIAHWFGEGAQTNLQL